MYGSWYVYDHHLGWILTLEEQRYYITCEKLKDDNSRNLNLQEIAEMYEQEQNLEQAIVYYEKAVDLFQSEEVSTSANQCKQKVAQFAAQLEQ